MPIYGDARKRFQEIGGGGGEERNMGYKIIVCACALTVYIKKLTL